MQEKIERITRLTDFVEFKQIVIDYHTKIRKNRIFKKGDLSAS